MNRIKISPLATAYNSPQPIDLATTLSLDYFDKLTNRSDDEFSVFVPMHYERNYAYPLIVWLHANGEKCSQIQRILPQASMRNYVGIAPQAPVGNFEAGYFWDEDPDSIDLAHDAIMAAVDCASMRFNVASNRIFIAGSGGGGTMAFRIALERPDIFAGVVSINGPVPSREKPLGRWSQCRELPVFWAHSRSSEEFDQEQLCKQLRLLHIAGFSVNLRQYPSDEFLTTKSLADMDKWIMEMISSSVHNPKEAH
jgi:phospholipase/carboxylesterase